MKLVIISIIIMIIILLVSFIILFVSLFKLWNKISNVKKIKYYCAKQVDANINIVNFNNIEVSDNNFAKDKALIEMLKYLETKDIVNHNNAAFDVFNILEKPMQYHLQTNNNDNYLLVNIIDILCHHRCVLNPLHLINYLFNNCHNQRCPQQNYDHDRHKNNNSIKFMNVFNKIIINDSTPNNNLLISKKCNHHLE